MSSKLPTDPGAVYRPSAGPSTPSSLAGEHHASSPADRNDSFHDHDDIHTPPPYSEPSSSTQNAVSSSAALARRVPPPSSGFYIGLPKLDYTLYAPPTFTLSPDHIKVSTYSHDLSTNPKLLKNFITLQASVPPKQLVVIKGKKDGQVIFDVKLNIMSLLVPPEKGGKGDSASAAEGAEGWHYIKVVEKEEEEYRGGARKMAGVYAGDLDSWIERFCQDQTTVKQFILERVVTNWDSDLLDGRIRSLIASTGFKGDVSITYPAHYSQVIINSPDKVNRFISNVTSLFAGKAKYSVIKAVWPYADKPTGEGRRFVAQSELEWWAEWKDALRNAVVKRHKGWVSIEDRLEFLMAGGTFTPAVPNWEEGQ